jgi:hypothetical protein
MLREADKDVTPQPFAAPPLLHNESGQVRGVGFELEYSGLDIKNSARLVIQVFGGEHEVESTFVHHVRTRHGDFSVEIDTAFLKEKSYEKPLRALGMDPEHANTQWLENALLGALSTVVPVEIGTPALPATELEPLDELRRLLHARGAKGTRASVFYAFGMHINPEVPSLEPDLLRDYLRAFLLLYPWLKAQAEVDISRRISPYINSFPAEYATLILRPDYAPLAGQLIDDYLAFNPTRNRPLDMLPVFACIDPQGVAARVEGRKLVKPRPAFHYRLPNCMIDEPDWTLAKEWNAWVEVERLAVDREELALRSREYLSEQRH